MDHSRFAIGSELTVETGPGGLVRFAIANQHAEALVYLHGAQVMHFQPRGQKPLLWASPNTVYADGRNLRGGAPVCWPWFGPHPFEPKLPAHGIVRTRAWEPVETARLHDGATRVVLQHVNDPAGAWPFRCTARLEVTVGRELTIDLVTANTGDEPFTYQDALHTYLAVGDVRRCTVHGVEGCTYIDKTDQHRRKQQQGPLAITRETVAIFTGHRGAVEVEDAAWGRRLRIAKQGSDETVVWNPWEVAASTMSDLGARWPEMLCIEAATCGDRRISVMPGNEHRTRQVVGLAG
ncbi:MAG: D-hexose-6-phosphate mutarotase [Planctomycetes bacterium]|nr:D-hexose-6-phosphate mutarotase [Planctomycetota bacterium]